MKIFKYVLDNFGVVTIHAPEVQRWLSAAADPNDNLVVYAQHYDAAESLYRYRFFVAPTGEFGEAGDVALDATFLGTVKISTVMLHVFLLPGEEPAKRQGDLTPDDAIQLMRGAT